MALVHEQQKVLREVIQQRHGRRAGRTAGNDAGVVLDAAAEADLLQHLDVIHRALADALGLKQLVVLLEPALTLLHLALDLENGAVELVARGDVVRGGVDGHMADNALRHTADGVDLGDAVDLVAEELHTDGPAGPVDGVNLHGIAAHAERVSGEIQVISLVADLHKLLHQLLAGLFHARAK